METKIEELAQEQAKRAEYREKERVEVNQLNEEIQKEQIYMQDKKKRADEKRRELDKAVLLNKKLQREIEKLDKTKQLLETDITRYEKERSEHVHILKTYDGQVDMAKKKMEKLLESEPWIRAEEPFFGREGTLYDFKHVEPLQLTEEIK